MSACGRTDWQRQWLASVSAYKAARLANCAEKVWDHLVLTAANARQAAAYRLELASRERPLGTFGEFFPSHQQSHVIADPPGARLGSGGATLRVLNELFPPPQPIPASARILLVHSGGLSQRLPVLAAAGKVFTPLPLRRPDGQIATLFDQLYITWLGLADSLGPGLLVASGDVWLHTAGPIGQPSSEGVTALSLRVEPEQAAGHGTFDVEAPTGRIVRTLQKASPAELAEAGFIGPDGRVWLDTGLLFFGDQALERLADLARELAAELDRPDRLLIDLYADLCRALTPAPAGPAYVGPTATPRGAWIWQALRRALADVPFQATALPEARFLHLGTSRQFRDTLIEAAAGLGPRQAGSRVRGVRLGRHACLIQSVLEAGPTTPATVGHRAIVDHCILHGPFRIGAGSVVSQIAATRGGIDLGPDLMLFEVPIEHEAAGLRVVHVLAGIHDDFKRRADDPAATFLNEPLAAWLDRHGLSTEVLWPDGPEADRTLWSARLYPVANDRADFGDVLWMSHPARRRQVARQAWLRAERLSMQEILDRADVEALRRHREVVQARLRAVDLLEAIRTDSPGAGASLPVRYESLEAHQEAEQTLVAAARSGEPTTPAGWLRQARQWQTAARVCEEAADRDPAAVTRARTHSQQAFQAVARAIGGRRRLGWTMEPVQTRLEPGQCVEASCPVRLDLAGGWTDTPPYCLERGGAVVNVAIAWPGVAPIRVRVEVTAQPCVCLASSDQNRQCVVERWEELEAMTEPGHPFALHAAALEAVGLGRRFGPKRLSDGLARWGGGLTLVSHSAVPKGSGLGASSILGAALLGALGRLLTGSIRRSRLLADTLRLEQRLGLGGGWQDQVGGVIGGLKLTTSRPGAVQRLKIQRLRLSPAALREFQDRLVVYFTGQQRLARDILRQAMGQWLSRRPGILSLMQDLHDGALRLAEALEAADWQAVADGINRYWSLKKALTPGAATPHTEALFDRVRSHTLAACLAGAGGGGFAFFLARDRSHAAALRRLLEDLSEEPGQGGLLVEAAVDEHGLRWTSRPAPSQAAQRLTGRRVA